ncbi:MAG: transposase [Gammaproteobacteria bacterium]|nr:transposase [Gammaproteobacteria bacterium]
MTSEFDQGHACSDGGTLLLKAADRRIGLTKALVYCMNEARQKCKIIHTLTKLFKQRVFSIACGYPDCNDEGRLFNDLNMKFLTDRDPTEGTPLASQATLSRFKNSIDPYVCNSKDVQDSGRDCYSSVQEASEK